MTDTRPKQEQLIEGIPAYEAVTKDVRIRVQSFFMPSESNVEESRYFWGYRIEITNLGTATVQLLNRHWIITDANAKSEEVMGPGVIGQEPTLKTDEYFVYTSGCPLTTSSGFMQGHYEMIYKDGEQQGKLFMVDIPAFSLDSPYSNHMVN